MYTSKPIEVSSEKVANFECWGLHPRSVWLKISGVHHSKGWMNIDDLGSMLESTKSGGISYSSTFIHAILVLSMRIFLCFFRPSFWTPKKLNQIQRETSWVLEMENRGPQFFRWNGKTRNETPRRGLKNGREYTADCMRNQKTRSHWIEVEKSFSGMRFRIPNKEYEVSLETDVRLIGGGVWSQ